MKHWTLTFKCIRCYGTIKVEHNESKDGPRPEIKDMAPMCCDDWMVWTKVSYRPCDTSGRPQGPAIIMAGVHPSNLR